MAGEQRRFSVFLVPAAGDFLWAEGVIRELAARYGAFPFEPHVTLYGGPFAGEKELEPLRRVLAGLAADEGPITLSVAGLDATEEHFRSLFVSFREELRLRHLHETVRRAAPRDGGYVLEPHLSLLYADIPLAEKRMAARTVHLDRGEMLFDVVKIVAPDPATGWRDPLRWQTLFREELAKACLPG